MRLRITITTWNQKVMSPVEKFMNEIVYEFKIKNFICLKKKVVFTLDRQVSTTWIYSRRMGYC